MHGLLPVPSHKHRRCFRTSSASFPGSSSVPPGMPSVSEALFYLCRGANTYNFWGVPEFLDTYHGFLYFLTFLVFVSGFFILLV